MNEPRRADIERLFGEFDADLSRVDGDEFPRSTFGTHLALALDQTLSNVAFAADDVCLDMGCGSGLQALTMLNSGAPRVAAFDINERAVELVSARFDRLVPGANVEIAVVDVASAPRVPRPYRVMAFNPPGFVKPSPRTSALMDQALFARSVDDLPRPLLTEFLEKWVAPQLVVGGIVAFTWATFVRVVGQPPTPSGVIELVEQALTAEVSGARDGRMKAIRAPLAGYPGYDVFDGLSEETVHLEKIDFENSTFEFYVVVLERTSADTYSWVDPGLTRDR